MEPQDEGMSTKKKIAAGAALGVAVPAAVGVARKLIGSDDEEDGSANQGPTRSRGSTASRSSSSSTSSSGARRSTSSRSTSGGSSARSKQSGSTSRSKKSGGSARSTSSGTKRSSSTRGTGRTKEQLYNTAKRLKIDGRSKMTKAQLERAVARAQS